MADWFTVNVRDAPWRSHATFGSSCRFESPDAPFPQLGINLRVLRPGQPNCLYHSESLQEDFLVLHGECDKDVPLDIGFRIMRALRSADVQLIVVKGGGHRLSELHTPNFM